MKCAREFNMNAGVQRPTEDTFNRYLTFFLSDLPYYDCVKAGHASYSTVDFFFETSPNNILVSKITGIQ